MSQFKVCVYIPEESLETVKQAMFRAGAGSTDKYDSFCWQVKGQGQFRPLKGSCPAKGSVGKLETVVEYRVETVCDESVVQGVVDAIRESRLWKTVSGSVYISGTLSILTGGATSLRGASMRAITRSTCLSSHQSRRRWRASGQSGLSAFISALCNVHSSG